jgi:pimeloyl-ACP methyl ester carboxylesterase
VVGVVGVDNLHAPAWAFTDEQIDQFLAPMRADFVPAVTAFVTDMFPAGSDSVAIHRALASMLAMPPEIAVSALDNLFHYDLPGAADALRVPLRLVNDDRYPVMVEAWREHGVDVAVTVLEQVGHFPMFTAPEEFRQALRKAIVGLEE